MSVLESKVCSDLPDTKSEGYLSMLLSSSSASLDVENTLNERLVPLRFDTHHPCSAVELNRNLASSSIVRLISRDIAD